jgi:hypothetical protein
MNDLSPLRLVAYLVKDSLSLLRWKAGVEVGILLTQSKDSKSFDLNDLATSFHVRDGHLLLVAYLIHIA